MATTKYRILLLILIYTNETFCQSDNLTQANSISYSQHEALCEARLTAEKTVDEEKIRLEELNLVCPYIDCSLRISLTLCPEQCIGRNNSEAGIWYLRPYTGKDLVIIHNLPEVQATCTVEPPFSNYNLQVSKPTSPIYRDVLSADNNRVILQNTNGTSCKLIVKDIQMKDHGKWKFFIETKQGQNRTLKKFVHNLSLRHNETNSRAICKDQLSCSMVTPNICRKFPMLERDCPITCGLCTCHDEIDCSEIPIQLCQAYPEVRQRCLRTCGVCEDRKEKRLGGWVNGTCIASDNERSCGPGQLKQTRQCTNGTYEKCSAADSERNMVCNLQDCQKTIGKWVDQGTCEWMNYNATSQNCGVRIQRQVRTCLDGTLDRCTCTDTSRAITCREAGTAIPCEVVIQVHNKRKDSDFAKNWNSYKTGFGSIEQKNFWLGLNTIYQITKSGDYGLEVTLKTSDGTIKTVNWDSFQVNGEHDKFKLEISGFKPGSSELSDKINFHNHMKFSTMDQDNDSSGNHCSRRSGGNGGWWFGACYHSNLNRGDGNGPQYNSYYEESIMILKRKA